MTSTSPDKQTCKLWLLTIGSEELPVKLNVKIGLHQKLRVYFRLAEQFVYELAGGGYDDASPKFEIFMVGDDGETVVLQEHQTPKQCWDAKANRKYYMCVWQLPDMDDTRGPAP